MRRWLGEEIDFICIDPGFWEERFGQDSFPIWRTKFKTAIIYTVDLGRSFVLLRKTYFSASVLYCIFERQSILFVKSKCMTFLVYEKIKKLRYVVRATCSTNCVLIFFIFDIAVWLLHLLRAVLFQIHLHVESIMHFVSEQLLQVLTA